MKFENGKTSLPIRVRLTPRQIAMILLNEREHFPRNKAELEGCVRIYLRQNNGFRPEIVVGQDQAELVSWTNRVRRMFGIEGA